MPEINNNHEKGDKIEQPKPSFIKELITFIVLALIIVVPIRLYIAQPFIVNGSSMSPTFETGQYLIVDQISYRFDEPERGDVIIFRFPNDPSKFFIKRIIGLPNETVELIGENVFITTRNENGTERIELDEEYVVLEKENSNTTTLGETEYFVMGDNRLASLDSRSWGPLEEEFIIGRAYLRLLPFGKLGILPGNDQE